MSRQLPAALRDEIEAPELRPFFAVSIDLPDPVYAWSGVGEITFDGKTFDGVGSLGGISAISEQADGTASGISLTLSGIDPEFTQYLINQPYRGAHTAVYVGALDAGFAEVVAWKRLSTWRLNAVSIVDDESGMTITVECEGAFIDQTRARVRRFTNEEQQRRYPGDKFFEYMAAMQEVRVIWGPEA
jgi:hypothetical protein